MSLLLIFLFFSLQIDIESQIKNGGIKIGPDEDALTVVFGREQSAYLRGVGCGVTANKYWHCPRQRTSSKDKIKILELQLENEKLLHQKKDDEVKNLSLQMAATNDKLNKVLAQLDSQGLLSSTKQDVSFLRLFDKLFELSCLR